MEHQDLTDSRKDPLCISQLKISSSSLDPLPQANMAEDLTKSRRHSPIKVEGSEETWGVEDDDDLTDPIFDTIEGNGHSDPTSCFDADLSEYKKKATVIVEEYFGTNDVVSVVNELKELGMAEYRYYFVKKLVSMAMDRHDKEKEMAAFLLSTLYADVIDPPEVYRGFNKLVASADDLSVDIPDAVDVLAVFVARAIVDDILPPAFLKKQMKLLPDNSKGVEVLRKAEKSYLATPLHAEVVEKRWGGTDNWTAEDVKARINDLLKEYVMSGDKKEAFRCIKGLKVPFFHHEIVKRALIMAMERRKAQVRLLDLLKETIEVGLINSTQVTKGFSRIIDSIEDLSLDIPDARRILQSFISKAASEGWLCASSLKSLSADAGEKLLENSSANVFKDKAKSIIREYFLSGDTSEVVHCLDTELNASSSQLRAIFVKYLITLAMDRKKREKEMACVLVSTLGFPPKDVRSAFSMLIESADDTALDNPVVVEDLAMFLARAVVDEVLAPRDLEEVLNQTPEAGSSVGEKVIQMAKTLLKARLSGERILRCWGGGGIETNSPGSTVKEVKEKIQILLEEYVSGGDLREASRCVKELGMPFFHHEVVKKSVVRIIEEKENEERLWKLLKVCFDSGLVTIYQMTKGFKRVDESLEDLSLDVPDAAKKFSSCVERGKLEGFLDESFASEDSQSKKQNGSRIETTCGLLLRQLQEIWNEMGETEDEKDASLADIEKECLSVYKRKVEEASRGKANLLKEIAVGRAEIAAIGSSMGGQEIHSNSRLGENLKEELENVNVQLDGLRKRKAERMIRFNEVIDQLLKLSLQLGNPTDYLKKFAAEETDLSLQRLEELRSQLGELQNEKSKRLEEVECLLKTLNSLCSVLGEDFKGMIRGIHSSLVDSNTRDVSRSTLDKLDMMIVNLREAKLQRMQKVQDLAVSLLELWNLLDTPAEEQKIFHNVTCSIALTESEITEANILSVASIKRVEDEVIRLSKIKITKIKEVILRKRLELEEISRKMHMATEVLKSENFSVEAIESGVKDPEQLLEQIDSEIAKVKEEASSRKEILEKVEKWMSACEEESWLEEYNRDDNRYNAGRGAHLTLKRAEKARLLVNKLPGMVEALTAKVTAWENERGNEFLYDGVRVLSMLGQYKTVWEEKEHEKQRQRDMKKLHGQLITEQEALYGSKPSPNKSGKKPLRTPVNAAMNRKLSLGGAMLHQSLKHEKATLNSKRTKYYDQNATSRRDSALPTLSGRRNSELPGRIRSKNVPVAGKAARSPMLRKPLSPVTSNILNSPEDHHKDAYTTKERILTPKTNEEKKRAVPTTPAASVAMTEATTPFTPAVEKRMDEEDVIVEYSFEEVRAGFC